MDKYNVIVLMSKDAETGFLSETVDSYTIQDGMEKIESIYLREEGDRHFIFLTLTTDDVEDWEYYGIYELYDEEIYQGYAQEVLDGSGEYNPRWTLKLEYNPDRQPMEEKLNKVLKLHLDELSRIKPLFLENKERFINESEQEEVSE